MAKLIQHIKNESLVDFVKEAQDILDAQYAQQVQELEELLMKGTSDLVSEASMTRKHFELAASAIKAADPKKRKALAQHHAEVFAKANPRFDKAKFFKASGVND